MEKLLKRYLGQRQAEAREEFSLHPATRNLLQGEVAKKFPVDHARAHRAVVVWPRFALAGVFTAMLVATVLILNQKKSTTLQVAQQAATPVDARKPTGKVQRKIESFSATRQIPAVASARVESDTSDTGTPANVASRSETFDGVSEAVPMKDSSAKAKEFAFETAAAPAVAADESTSLAKIAAAPASPHWTFVQQNLRAYYRENLLSPAQPKVLQSFDLIRNGDELRLVESDGSIYVGEILSNATKQAHQKGESVDAAQSGFAFRVSGQSLQLNRPVTFSGQLSFSNINERLSGDLAGVVSRTPSSEFKKAADTGHWIQGKISIGGTNEFEIRAVEK